MTDGDGMAYEIPGSNYERNNERYVDLSTKEWTETLAAAPVYKKTALVHIRPAVPGELITTILANGNEETRNVAGEQEVIITNPSGEKQVVSLEKAVQRYDLTDTPGLFLAKGTVRAVDNPFDCPITIRAPWGSPQYGGVGCKIAALYDPSAPDVVSMDRYIIGKDEFIETYGLRTEGLIASDSELPAASPFVLQALNEYGSQNQGSTPNTHVRLGGIVLALCESGFNHYSPAS